MQRLFFRGIMPLFILLLSFGNLDAQPIVDPYFLINMNAVAQECPGVLFSFEGGLVKVEEVTDQKLKARVEEAFIYCSANETINGTLDEFMATFDLSPCLEPISYYNKNAVRFQIPHHVYRMFWHDIYDSLIVWVDWDDYDVLRKAIKSERRMEHRADSLEALWYKRHPDYQDGNGVYTAYEKMDSVRYGKDYPILSITRDDTEEDYERKSNEYDQKIRNWRIKNYGNTTATCHIYDYDFKRVLEYQFYCENEDKLLCANIDDYIESVYRDQPDLLKRIGIVDSRGSWDDFAVGSFFNYLGGKSDDRKFEDQVNLHISKNIANRYDSCYYCGIKDYDFMDGANGFPQPPELYVVWKKNKRGVIDSKGKIIIPLEYDSIHYELPTGVFKVRKNERYGILDSFGKVIVPIEFDNFEYSDGICMHRVGATIVYGQNYEYDKSDIELKGGYFRFTDANGKIPFAVPQKVMSSHNPVATINHIAVALENGYKIEIIPVTTYKRKRRLF